MTGQKKIGKKIGILTLFVTMLVISSSITAIGTIVEKNENNIEPLPTTAVAYVGNIYIGENVIEIDTENPTIDLGLNGGSLIIEASVQFRLGGWCDHGYACIKYGTTSCCDDEGENRDTTLAFNINNCKPGDTFQIVLWAKYEDCINPDFEKSEISTITIKIYNPELSVNPSSINPTDPRYPPGSTLHESFKVLNTGGGSLNWQITNVAFDTNYPWSCGSLQYSPTSGSGVVNGDPDTVYLTFEIPRRADGFSHYFKWTITVSSITTGQTKTVSLYLETKHVSKGLQMPFFANLESRFPQLYRILMNRLS